MADDKNADENAQARHETPAERDDRNFDELLQELRVAQTGIQILFAFQLSLPFTQRFTKLDPSQRNLYLVTMIASALATSCLIAPVNQHRILFRHKRKRELVTVANRLALIGLVFLIVAVVGSVYLIFDFVVGAPLAGAVAALLAVWLLLAWYVLPLWERFKRRDPPSDGAV